MKEGSEVDKVEDHVEEDLEENEGGRGEEKGKQGQPKPQRPL